MRLVDEHGRPLNALDRALSDTARIMEASLFGVDRSRPILFDVRGEVIARAAPLPEMSGLAAWLPKADT